MALDSGSSAVRVGSGGGQASGSEASHGDPSHHRRLLRSEVLTRSCLQDWGDISPLLVWDKLLDLSDSVGHISLPLNGWFG